MRRMWMHYKAAQTYRHRPSFDLPTCFAQWFHLSKGYAQNYPAAWSATEACRVLGSNSASRMRCTGKPYAMKYLRCIPQHAYLAFRSTYSAIVQVTGHCRRGRSLLSSYTHNLHCKRQDQVKPGDFCACLQVSVDLSQAFDTAPWDLLELALDRTGAPLELKALDHGLD